MADAVRTLLTRYGADTSDFDKASKKVIEELQKENQAFYKNRAEMGKVQKQITALSRENAKLDKAIKANTATKQQIADFEKNQAEIDKLRSKLGQLSTAQTLIKNNINKANAELTEQNDKLKKGQTAVSNFATAMKLAITGYAGKTLYEAFIGSNAQMEQYLTSFEVMFGSARKAEKMMSDLQQFASVTPFTLNELVPQATMLSAYNVGANEMIDTMTKLGNLSAGNSEKFERISLAYGQMLAKQKVSGEELRQMTEAGVPLLEALADALGVTTAEYLEMQEKGEVGIDTLKQAIDGLTTGTGKFSGMLEKQSQTMNGLISTVKDNLQQMGRDIGQDAFVEIKESITEVLEVLKKAQEDGSLAESIGFFVTSLTKLVKLLWDMREVVVAGTAGLIAFKTALKIGAVIQTCVVSINALKTANAGATASQVALNTAMNANPAMLVASAIGAIVSVVAMFAFTTNDATEAVVHNNEALAENVKLVDNSKARYEELSQKTELTATEKLELLDIQDELVSAYGAEGEALDLLNGKYDDNIKKLDEYQKRALLDQQASQYVATDTSYEGATNTSKKNFSQMHKSTYDQYFGGLSNASWNSMTSYNDENSMGEIFLSGDAIDKYRTVLSMMERLEDAGEINNDTYRALIKTRDEEKAKIDASVEAMKAEIDTADLLGDTSDRAMQTKQNLQTIYDRMGITYNTMTNNEEEYRKALELLAQTESEEGDLAEEVQLQKVKTAATGTMYRLGYLTQEVAGIKTVADANVALMKLEEQRWKQAIRINSYYDQLEYMKKYGAGSDYETAVSQLNTIKGLIGQIDKIKIEQAKLEESKKSGASSQKKEITALEKYTAALKKLTDDRVAAIDKEIAARKKLQETANIQKEIDQLNLQLKYGSHLDERSKLELTKSRDDLVQQQRDTAWEDSMNAKKEALLSASDKVSNLLTNSFEPTAQSIVNNNTKSQNISILNQAGMTNSQLAYQIKKLLGLI